MFSTALESAPWWGWPRTLGERWIAGGLAALIVPLAVGLFVIGAEESRDTQALRERGVSTTGTITAVAEAKALTVTVVFTTASGRRVELDDEFPPGAAVVGEPVPVLYDPRDPGDAQLVRSLPADAGGAGDVVAGFGVLVLGLWQVVRAIHGGRRTP